MTDRRVRLDDEMAALLGLEGGPEYRNHDVASQLLARFASVDASPQPVLDTSTADFLAELVVLIDGGGCEGLDATVATATGMRESQYPIWQDRIRENLMAYTPGVPLEDPPDLDERLDPDERHVMALTRDLAHQLCAALAAHRHAP